MTTPPPRPARPPRARIFHRWKTGSVCLVDARRRQRPRLERQGQEAAQLSLGLLAGGQPLLEVGDLVLEVFVPPTQFVA
jgi:hypothetical protein